MEIETAKPQMSLGEQLWKTIVDPRRAFQTIKENPRILVPALIIIAVMVALTILIFQETTAYTREVAIEIGKQYGLSADQVNASQQSSLLKSVMGVVFSVPLLWLLQAAILAIYNKLAAGEAHFKHLYAVAVYSSVPTVIHQLLSSVLVKSVGMHAAKQVDTSLAIFLGNQSSNFLFGFLKTFDIFTIWALALLVLGGAVVMNKKYKGLGLYIFILWSLFSSLMGVIVMLFPMYRTLF